MAWSLASAWQQSRQRCSLNGVNDTTAPGAGSRGSFRVDLEKGEGD
ncbi:hypothetical protein PF003_g18778 [Phytophthora fragariae]|nr:hypothetical protein PF003_g18778 [Phytophthora fragariae]